MEIAANSTVQKRRERQEATRRRLLEAAVTVVGDSGYANSSVARITAAAGIAHGTFYNYFESQQDLFDQLLPHMGQRLLDEIRQAIGSERDFWRREAIGFEVFFDFVQRYPQFYRILNEAETHAPTGYRIHIDNMVAGYMRALRRGVRDGAIRPLSETEIEAVVLVLLAARNYLCMRYALAGPLPPLVRRAYLDIVHQGLARSPVEQQPFEAPSAAAAPQRRPWTVAPAGQRDEAPTFAGTLAGCPAELTPGELLDIATDFARAAARYTDPVAQGAEVRGFTVTTVRSRRPIGAAQALVHVDGTRGWTVFVDLFEGPPRQGLLARATIDFWRTEA